MKTQYISKKLFGAILGVLALATASCADDLLFNPRQSGLEIDSDTQLVISLAVPSDSEGVDDEQSAAKSRAASSDLNSSEKKINDLRLIAFGSEGGTSVVNRELTIPSELPTAPRNGIATYQVKDLAPGKYSVYVIANMGESLASVATEGDLKAYIRDYTSALPAPGNLPMVYEPSAMIEVKGSGASGAPTLEATMVIAAVKVKYSIVFDSAVNADVFASAGLKINGASILNVPKQAYLVANPAKTDIDLRDVASSGSYFTDFSDTPANASLNDRDIIETSGSGSATLDSYSDKWVWTGTVYLPERYAKTDAGATTLLIDATMTRDGNDSNEHSKYSIVLSEYDGAAAGERSMPRGTYYEVVGRVKTLGDASLDASITAKDWTVASLDVDFMHTFLKVSKTRVKVTSLENEKITYDTDGSGGVSFLCETQRLNLPIIIASVSPSDKSITFSVNPSVDITKLPQEQTTGTATCYVTAGNIRKRIDVDFDIMPFFSLNPPAIKIMFSGNQTTDTKEYEYVTNLGGLFISESGNKANIKLGYNGSTTLKEFTATTGNSIIKVSCSDPTAATGTITVTATSDPGTTTQFFYDVFPQAARTAPTYESFKEPTIITVMPPLGAYRIYFRAINDWHIYNGGETHETLEWLEGKSSMDKDFYPFEDYGSGPGPSKNWIDYWYCAYNDEWDNAWDNGPCYQGSLQTGGVPYEANHKVYIWTQIGETTSSDITNEIWRFTDMYNRGSNMKEDYNNRGWYFYDLDPNAQSWVVDQEKLTNTQKHPEPGTTLMIFNNHTNAKLGYSVHRATHHLDPGIPLFDFEDREGWVVYDPTMDPYYRVYDEKPYIEDVVYTIWSDVKPTGWYRKYGVAENSVGTSGNVQQFTVWSNQVTNDAYQTVNGYHRFQIRMKAVRGDYEKAIRVKFTGVRESGTTVTNPGFGHYVYYYYNVPEKKAWTNPKLYLFSDSKSMNWGQFISPMTSFNADEGVYYQFEVPADYYNGYAIFVNGDNTNEQFPYANKGGLKIENKNKVFYSNSSELNGNDISNQDKYWKEYGQQPSGSTTTTTGEDGFVLFNGRAYPSNEGYFNSKTKTWTPGKPF